MDQPLTLYLDLKPGTKPDLAVVAKAALEFDALVKELAFQIDPSLAITLDLESGTEGSLKLNSLLKSAKDKALDPKTYAAIALGVLSHFGMAVVDHVTSETIEEVQEQVVGEGQTLSQQDLEAIAESVSERLASGAGRKEARRVFSELQADNNITGVGVSPKADAKPRTVVPSTTFPERSIQEQDETPEKKRTTTKIIEVVLISPVLLDAERRWKFKDEGPEFGAIIKDRKFLEDVLSGRYHLEMRGGLRMTIELEIKEEYDGRVWAIKERNVLRVLKSEAGSHQESFLSPPQKPGNGNHQ